MDTGIFLQISLTRFTSTNVIGALDTYFPEVPLQGLHLQILSGPWVYEYFQLSFTVQSFQPDILSGPWIQQYFFKFPLQGLHPQILSGP